MCRPRDRTFPPCTGRAPMQMPVLERAYSFADLGLRAPCSSSGRPCCLRGVVAVQVTSNFQHPQTARAINWSHPKPWRRAGAPAAAGAHGAAPAEAAAEGGRGACIQWPDA